MTFSAYIHDLLCLISSLYPWPSLPISMTFSVYILIFSDSSPAYIHDLLCLYPWPLPISMTFSDSSPAYILDLCLYPWPSPTHLLPISLTFSAYIPDLLCLISCLYPWPSLPISPTSPPHLPIFLTFSDSSPAYSISLTFSVSSACIPDSSPAYIPDLLTTCTLSQQLCCWCWLLLILYSTILRSSADALRSCCLWF